MSGAGTLALPMSPVAAVPPLSPEMRVPVLPDTTQNSPPFVVETVCMSRPPRLSKAMAMGFGEPAHVVRGAAAGRAARGQTGVGAEPPVLIDDVERAGAVEGDVAAVERVRDGGERSRLSGVLVDRVDDVIVRARDPVADHVVERGAAEGHAEA